MYIRLSDTFRNILSDFEAAAAETGIKSEDDDTIETLADDEQTDAALKASRMHSKQ